MRRRRSEGTKLKAKRRPHSSHTVLRNKCAYTKRNGGTPTNWSDMNSMAFHGGVSETILFDGWRTSNWQGMGWSMVGIILLTAIFEGLKCYREYLFTHAVRLREKEDKRSRRKLLFSEVHMLQTLIHVVQMIVGYFLMLIFMTYNVWLCVAMIIGTAIGYWLFAWEKSNNDNTDCCS